MSWWQVAGLVLIIEALLPFISPKQYRAMAAQIGSLPDRVLRWAALGLLVIGTVFVVLGR